MGIKSHSTEHELEGLLAGDILLDAAEREAIPMDDVDPASIARDNLTGVLVEIGVSPNDSHDDLKQKIRFAMDNPEAIRRKLRLKAEVRDGWETTMEEAESLGLFKKPGAPIDLKRARIETEIAKKLGLVAPSLKEPDSQTFIGTIKDYDLEGIRAALTSTLDWLNS